MMWSEHEFALYENDLRSLTDEELKVERDYVLGIEEIIGKEDQLRRLDVIFLEMKRRSHEPV